MNDTNYMDNVNDNGNSCIPLESKTTVMTVSDSICHGQFSCGRYIRPLILIFCGLMTIAYLVLAFSEIKTNAAENSVYVDSTYIQEQFGNYNYYLIVTDGSGNYMTLYSDAQICYNGKVYRAFCTNHYSGYKTMKVVDDYLVIDESGTSYHKWSSVSLSFNSEGVPSSYNTIIYANKDIYATGTSNTGSPTVGTTVYYSVANNIGSKPIEEPTPEEPAPEVTVDCKFTDENICNKLDLIITLLIVMIAIRMFSPLANNHKRGLQKKEK